MKNFEGITKPLLWFMALLLSVLAVGCGGGIGGGSPILGLPGVVSLTVTPVAASIPVTGTQQYKATAAYSDGSSRDVTASAVWTSASPAIATIAPATGLATGVSAGASIITATLGTNAATATLTVTAATSVSFKVTPTTASTPVSGTQQFAAIQTFSDGTTQDRTLTSVWATSGASAANATVGAATGQALGITVTPVGAPAIINATFTPPGGAALIATPATLIVNAATPVSFVVKPTTASTTVGGTQQFAAIQTFSDGTTFDRTVASTWSSANVPAGGAAVASLSADGVTGGLVTGLVGGTASIGATFGALVATPASLTVGALTSVSFVVQPATGSVPVSGTQQYTAIETLSNGSTIDRTYDPLTVWTAIDVAPAIGVATFSVNGATGGLATGKVVGVATVRATYTPPGGVALVSTPANLTVTAATVTSISVTPAAASILLGQSQQYTALAILSDGSSLDVTANPATVWASVSPLVAANPVNGLTTGLTVGTSNITASYGGKTSPLPPTVGAATLTVTAPIYGPAGAPPILRSVAPHGLIAWNAITNSAGPSHIYGDVALTQAGPGGTIASVTGPGTNDSGVAPLLASSIVTNSAGVTPGVITAADNGSPVNIAALPQLLVDLRAVYDDLMARAAPVTALTTIASAANVPGGTFGAATDLSGYVLSPGIYTTAVTYGLSNTLGPLVLDAKGNADAVFIIRSTGSGISGLTSTTGSIVLQGGAQAKNVFWVVDNLTVGGSTFFQGTVVSGHAITLLTGATVQGRMLAGALGLASGALTLTGTNIITVPQ